MLLTNEWQQFTPTIDTLISNPTQEQVFFKTTIEQIEPILLIGDDTLFIKANYTVWLKSNTRLNISVSSNTDKIENMYRVGDFGADVGDINNTTGTTGITLFTNLQDTPNDYENQANKFLVVNESADGITFTEIDINEVPDYTVEDRSKVLAVDDYGNLIWKELIYECQSNTFIKLNDTPSYYDANKVIAVNSTGDGIVYVDVAEIANAVPDTDGYDDGYILTIVDGKPTWNKETDSFISLTDTPNSYDNGKFIKVDANDNKIIYSTVREVPNPEPSDDGKVLTVKDGYFVWSETDVSTNDFIQLKDTPSEYTNNENKLVAVNSSATGLEFVEKESVGTTEFKKLIDTPNDYAGNAGKIVAVKQTEDGVEFIEISASDIPEHTDDDNGKVLTIDENGDLIWTTIDISSVGASTFIELTDTPDDYIGQAGRVPIVSADESKIEFADMQSCEDGSVVIYNNSTTIIPLQSSQTITNDDILKIIEARIQLLETIRPDSNIGIIYKCIRPDAGEVFPINKGIIEYLSEFIDNYTITYKTIHNEIFQYNKKYNIDDINNIIVTEYLDENGNSIGNIQSESLNKKRVTTSDGAIWDYDDTNGYWVKLDVDSVTNYFIGVCGRVFLNNTGISTNVYYKYFDSTSANTCIDVTVDTPAIDIDGWSNPKFLRSGTSYGYFLSKPNDIFKPIKFIRYDRENNGVTEYLYTVQQFIINENYELEDTVLIMQSEPIAEAYRDDYAYLFDISQDNTLLLTAYYKPLVNDTQRYYRFFVLDNNGIYKKIDTRLECKNTYSAHLIDNQSVAVLRAYSGDDNPHLYKLNLLPSLVCMEDRTVEVSNTFDLSSWTSDATKIKYASSIGSNQSDFDITVADEKTLRFISLLDNEEKGNVVFANDIKYISSSLGKTLVSQGDYVTKIDNFTKEVDLSLTVSSDVNGLQFTDNEKICVSYYTGDEWRIAVFDKDGTLLGVDVRVAGNGNTMKFDKKGEFAYRVQTEISLDSTTITIERYNLEDVGQVTPMPSLGLGTIGFSDDGWTPIDVEINGYTMLVSLSNATGSRKTKLYCIEDLSNIKEIASIDYGVSNDFKWTTNTYNCLVLKDGVSLDIINFK